MVNSQCKHSIPKAQTHLYTLWEDNICLSHGLVLYFLHATHITTYNHVFTIFLPSAASCMPIFFFIMNYTKWTYESEWQLLMDLMEMICNLGNQLGLLKYFGCSLTQPKILVYWPSYTKVAQPMKKLAQ